MKRKAIAGVAAACVIASLTWSRVLAGPPAPPPFPSPFGIGLLAGAPGLPPMPALPGGAFWDCPFVQPLPEEMLPDLWGLSTDLMEEPFPLLFGGGVLAGVSEIPPMPPPPGASFCGCPFGAPPVAEMFLDLLDLGPYLMEELRLTDDQLRQMLLMYVDYNDRTRQSRTALAGLHDEREIMMLRGKIDQAKLAKLDQETTKLASEVMSERLRMQREQLSKLSPQQVERLALFLNKLKPPCGKEAIPR